MAQKTDKEKLKQAEATIKLLKSKLETSAKLASLGKMAGEIAHEINNPLAIIMGRVDQIEMVLEDEEFEPETILGATEKIKATIRRITQIIKGLRAFAREEGVEVISSVPAKSLIEDVLGLCQERLKNGGVEISYAIDPQDLVIDCSRVRISQVLLNLINNAFDAVKNLKNPWIKIKIFQQDDDNVIDVMDCGIGIPEEVCERILTPFFTTKSMGKGTGLGLSISRDIVSSHHGRLEIVKNTPHTTFRVLFPINQKQFKKVS